MTTPTPFPLAPKAPAATPRKGDRTAAAILAAAIEGELGEETLRRGLHDQAFIHRKQVLDPTHRPGTDRPERTGSCGGRAPGGVVLGRLQRLRFRGATAPG